MATPAPIFVRRDDDAAPRILAALGLAVVAHLGLTLLVAALSALGLLGGHELPHPAPVDLVSVNDSQWSANRRIGDAPALAAPVQVTPKAAAAKLPHEELPHGQIVDVRGGNDQKPADAAYLADHDNTVAHQTRAREQTAHYVQAMPRKSTTVAMKDDAKGIGPKGEHGNGGKAQDELARREGAQARHEELPSERERNPVAVAQPAPHGELHNQAESDKQRGNSARLLLTPGQLASLEDPGSLGHTGAEGDDVGGGGDVADQSGAAPNDKLDVDQGDATFLNTREFRYAQFFNRLKQRVGEQWNADAILRRHDPRGLYAARERATIVWVTLRSDGRVADVKVKSSSGLNFLDEEAVAAFQRAGPFPNPPQALFDSEGLLRFGFGFYLEPAGVGGSGFRVYRGRD